MVLMIIVYRKSMLIVWNWSILLKILSRNLIFSIWFSYQSLKFDSYVYFPIRPIDSNNYEVMFKIRHATYISFYRH